MLLPKSKVPSLKVPLINGAYWNLDDQTPENFTAIFFYRGLHCPVCKGQLEEIVNNLDKFTERGINVIAISTDTEQKAKQAGEDWDIQSLPIGYNLSLEKAKAYGLFISEGISEKEPDYFSEPGMFLIKPDGTLFFSSIQSMPFTRPGLKDLFNGIDYVMQHNYPARGEVKEVSEVV